MGLSFTGAVKLFNSFIVLGLNKSGVGALILGINKSVAFGNDGAVGAKVSSDAAGMRTCRLRG